MDAAQPSGKDIHFISTPEHGTSKEMDLLRIAYTRTQKESPDFLSAHEGIDQNVDIKMSTLIFCAAPEPVLAMYDFIMATFVPNSDPVAQPRPLPSPESLGQLEVAQADKGGSDGKIRVLIKLEGVQGMQLFGSFLIWLTKVIRSGPYQ